MSCDEILDLLDDFADDRLPASRRRAVERHLELCAACRRELEELRSLLAEARRLPAATAPPRDLWPGIEARLRRAPRPTLSRWLAGLPAGRWLPVAAAAALVLALALPALLRGPGPATGGPAPGGTDAGASSLRNDLAAALERRRGELPAAAAMGLEESARRLEEAVGELRQALAEAPDERRLYLMLAQRQRQEADLLASLERL